MLYFCPAGDCRTICASPPQVWPYVLSLTEVIFVEPGGTLTASGAISSPVGSVLGYAPVAPPTGNVPRGPPVTHVWGAPPPGGAGVEGVPKHRSHDVNVPLSAG